MAHLLDVRDLRVDFRVHGGVIRAVEGVSFRVPHGKTVALVGESGSGKSVTAQAIMGILPHVAKITGGSILFDDPAAPGQPPIDIAAIMGAKKSTTKTACIWKKTKKASGALLPKLLRMWAYRPSSSLP